MEEDIVISEDLIRKEIIREWCGKISKDELKEIKKEKPNKLHDNLKNSELIEKVQKRISCLLEKRAKESPGLILDLDADDEFNS